MASLRRMRRFWTTHGAGSIPQETAMASAKVAFRDAVPGFDAMPLAQQEAVVADLRAAPVETEAQQYITEAAEARVAKNRKAWEEDPIATAEKALPNKPCDACEPRSERLRDVDGRRANTPRCSWRRATSTSRPISPMQRRRT